VQVDHPLGLRVDLLLGLYGRHQLLPRLDPGPLRHQDVHMGL